jgi:SAM-dependent methyltransferase
LIQIHREPKIEPVCGGAGPLRLRGFAWFMARFGHKSDQYLARYKANLFSTIAGTVVEIGPGAGANLRYLADKNIRWIGVEPNPFMRRHLENEARRFHMKVDLRDGIAEELPIDSGSIDFVISTLVLCSVVDPPRALREAVRVLRPGGKLLFIEHVAAPSGSILRILQSLVKPLWRKLGDGWHPDRQIGTIIRQAGFAAVEIQEFLAPLPIVRPHIAGHATKSGASLTG